MNEAFSGAAGALVGDGYNSDVAARNKAAYLDNLPPEERQKVEALHRKGEIEQAIYLLSQAARIRNDPAMMLDVKTRLRELRDEAGSLIDDLG